MSDQNLFSTPATYTQASPCGTLSHGYAPFQKTIPDGWGWSPDQSGTCTISTLVPNCCVQYVGSYGQNGSGFQTVSFTPDPELPPQVFRFMIYFLGTVPGKKVELTISNFLP
jgi:hypothetical protein